MRPELFSAGVMLALLGVTFYVVVIPISYAWAIPLVIAGGVMAGISIVAPPGSGPVQPPEGFRFCVYCSTPVAIGSERCQHCNGIQPKS